MRSVRWLKCLTSSTTIWNIMFVITSYSIHYTKLYENRLKEFHLWSEEEVQA